MYALFDALRERHPRVEFESCASGGGRIDHEILRRVERVWTSDSNDALDRQLIQRGASMVIPPEVMGSHIGPSRTHTTGRQHTMAFRGVTALFGHLGVEADITQCDDDEIAQLAQLIDIYQGYRDLLHGGDTVRFDTYTISAGTSLAHGVYAHDRIEALLAYCQLSSAMSLTPPMWRIPDLLADAQYRVDIVPTDPTGAMTVVGPASQQPDWVGRAQKGEPLTYSGEFLATVGLPAPIMWPESAVLVHLSCS
jgi:alpha-galactosidase